MSSYLSYKPVTYLFEDGKRRTVWVYSYKDPTGKEHHFYQPSEAVRYARKQWRESVHPDNVRTATPDYAL